jgi:hypothetical protein
MHHAYRTDREGRHIRSIDLASVCRAVREALQETAGAS